MKPFVSCSIFLLLIGCASQQPIPAGMSRVNVHVVAKGKEGVKQSTPRVAVYDAAPRIGKAIGEYELVDYSSLEDIVLWLKGSHDAMSTSQPAIFINPDRPSTTVREVWVGATVNLVNLTNKPLAAYSVSDGNEFDVTLKTNGGVAVPIKNEGLIEVLVDPSKPPVALMYAAPTPLVKRARSGELVTFDVPPGTYLVGSWHPRLPAGETRVDAVANGSVDCTIRVGVGAMSADASSSSK